jgi:hypothetical protein
MADLLDIAPAAAVEIVRINGARIKVGKLSVDVIASIIARFPELTLLLDSAPGASVVPRLVAQFGQAIAPIIAAGCGHAGDEKYEQHAAAMLVEHQLLLLKAILGLTFPNGLNPVMEAIAGLVSGADEQKPVRVRLKNSPSPSPRSSDADSRPIMQ